MDMKVRPAVLWGVMGWSVGMMIRVEAACISV